MTAPLSAPSSDLLPHALVAERRLLTIGSGKGGVGKTWLSVTLAHALARRGRKVLLFDGDLGLANVDIHLGLNPQVDLASIVGTDHPLRSAITRFTEDAAMSCGFDVLAGRSGSGALAGLSREALARLRHQLIDMAQDYDDVLLDLGAGLEPATMGLAHHQGRCLVVVTPEPTSITDAYAFMKVRRLRDPASPLAVVVNTALTKREGEATFATLAKACAAFLKFTPTLAGVVRRDLKVREAVRAQSPLLTRSPEAQAAQDVALIAEMLTKG